MSKPAEKKVENQKSQLHKELDKIVFDLTKNSEHKKTTKTEIIHEVKELKLVGADKKSIPIYIVYLPFVYVQNHRALLPKIVNEIQAKKKIPTFLLTHRTIINKKADFKQKVPRNRTLSQVYDSILDDLLAPGIVIGKRYRYHLDGSQHVKVFVNEESKDVLEPKADSIAQIYKLLTNRKISIEFRPEVSFIKVPLIKQPKSKTIKKGVNRREDRQEKA